MVKKYLKKYGNLLLYGHFYATISAQTDYMYLNIFKLEKLDKFVKSRTI